MPLDETATDCVNRLPGRTDVIRLILRYADVGERLMRTQRGLRRERGIYYNREASQAVLGPN
jgi:hypothetical protein